MYELTFIFEGQNLFKIYSTAVPGLKHVVDLPGIRGGPFYVMEIRWRYAETTTIQPSHEITITLTNERPVLLTSERPKE